MIKSPEQVILLKKEKEGETYYDVIIKENGRLWHAISDTVEIDVRIMNIRHKEIASVQIEFMCAHMDEVIKS